MVSAAPPRSPACCPDGGSAPRPARCPGSGQGGPDPRVLSASCPPSADQTHACLFLLSRLPRALPVPHKNGQDTRFACWPPVRADRGPHPGRPPCLALYTAWSTRRLPGRGAWDPSQGAAMAHIALQPLCIFPLLPESGLLTRARGRGMAPSWKGNGIPPGLP